MDIILVVGGSKEASVSKHNDRHTLSWHYLLHLLGSCNPLPLLSNGKIHNNGVSHGAVVSFSCNSGFQPLGSLQIKCFDGIWNESSPSCIGPVTLFNPLHYHISFFYQYYYIIIIMHYFFLIQIILVTFE